MCPARIFSARRILPERVVSYLVVDRVFWREGLMVVACLAGWGPVPVCAKLLDCFVVVVFSSF